MKIFYPLLVLSMTLPVLSARADEPKPLATAAEVDLERYLGTWYEIARLPTRFEKDCFAATATYERKDDEVILVTNRCAKGKLDGELEEAHGRVKLEDKATPSKLRVSFFRPFWGNYWILEVGKDYEYAVVGEPKRKYLWILSRTPVLDEAVIARLLAQAKAQGFDTTQIIRTPQKADAPPQTAPAAKAAPKP